MSNTHEYHPSSLNLCPIRPQPIFLSEMETWRLVSQQRAYVRVELFFKFCWCWHPVTPSVCNQVAQLFKYTEVCKADKLIWEVQAFLCARLTTAILLHDRVNRTSISLSPSSISVDLQFLTPLFPYLFFCALKAFITKLNVYSFFPRRPSQIVCAQLLLLCLAQTDLPVIK